MFYCYGENVLLLLGELQPSIDEVPDEVFTAPEEFNHHMKKQEADEKENFTNFQNVLLIIISSSTYLIANTKLRC